VSQRKMSAKARGAGKRIVKESAARAVWAA